jgi:taurine dioxygenase
MDRRVVGMPQRLMLIWDNWRMMHAVSGMDRGHSGGMHRTTIRGDYV